MSSITINTKTYNQDTQLSPDIMLYAGPGKTFAKKDDLVLKRQAPKPTSTFGGVARAELKLTRTLDTTGVPNSTGDAIIGCYSSFPVGAAGGDLTAIRTDAAELVLSNVGAALFDSHDITIQYSDV